MTVWLGVPFPYCYNSLIASSPALLPFAPGNPILLLLLELPLLACSGPGWALLPRSFCSHDQVPCPQRVVFCFPAAASSPYRAMGLWSSVLCVGLLASWGMRAFRHRGHVPLVWY